MRFRLTSVADLLEAVCNLDEDDQKLIAARLQRARAARGQRGAAFGAALSERERQVLGNLALGQSTKETAYALGISAVTVRVLVARAAAKLGVRSRAALLDHPEVRTLRPHTNPAGVP